MTVRILTEVQKQVIAHQYRYVKVPINLLAEDYKVSSRTIRRVLDEQGVAPVRKLKATLLYVQQELLPIEMIEPTFMDQVKSFFKSIFSKKQHHHNA